MNIICWIFGHKLKRCGNKKWKRKRFWSSETFPETKPHLYRDVKKKCIRCGYHPPITQCQIIDYGTGM